MSGRVAAILGTLLLGWVMYSGIELYILLAEDSRLRESSPGCGPGGGVPASPPARLSMQRLEALIAASPLGDRVLHMSSDSRGSLRLEIAEARIQDVLRLVADAHSQAGGDPIGTLELTRNGGSMGGWSAVLRFHAMPTERVRSD